MVLIEAKKAEQMDNELRRLDLEIRLMELQIINNKVQSSISPPPSPASSSFSS